MNYSKELKMYTKTILTTLMFCITLAFVKQKKHEALSLLRNRTINTIDLINKNESQSIKNLSPSGKNIIEIKSCWEEGDLASQYRYCSSLNSLQEF